MILSTKYGCKASEVRQHTRTKITTWESVAKYRKANKDKNLFEDYVLRPVLNLTLNVNYGYYLWFR
jgi:hypothetical protein